MKINPVSNVTYQRIIGVKKTKSQDETTLSVMSFKGDKGRAIGSVLGAAGALVGVAALSAIGIGLPLLPFVAAGVAAKAGGDAGSKYEDNHKKG